MLEALNAKAAPLSLADRLKAVRAAFSGRIVFTTSLGIEDQAITQAIFENDLGIEVVTLDTGRFFAETYAVWQATEEKYGKRIRAYYPKSEAVEDYVSSYGINGFYLDVDSRKACCHVRKVEPLARALTGAEVWITGLRAEQSANRASVPFAEADGERGLVKVNPLHDWLRVGLVAYIDDNAIPINALHHQGFPSIGCQPCTRAVKPGEPERAGRWWWEDEAKKECGLHVHAEASA